MNEKASYYDALIRALKEKHKYCIKKYERLLQDIRCDAREQSPEDKSLCFERNNSSRLISMAEYRGFLRGLEFAIDRANLSYYYAKEGDS